MRIACLLRDLRQARELSLRDVERMTGIARTDLSKVERGRMLPRDEWLEALEQAYGADRLTWYVPPSGAIAGVVIEGDTR
jgi:transcriptional regulator with XRE-family HTH domain